MKKFYYFLVLVTILIIGWMIWDNSKTIEKIPVSSQSVNSAYFKDEISSTLGKYVAANNGMTLYTFSKDSPRVSNCTGACLAKWPAYIPATTTLTALPENIGTITRIDGSTQFTWKDMPLYFYSGDKAEGDTNGQGLGGFWSVVNI